MTAFNDVYCLPKQFDISRINDGDGLCPVTYKACALVFLSRQLQLFSMDFSSSHNMVILSHLPPSIYAEFMKGHFTVQKTDHSFLNIAIDQAHEQHNCIVKDDGCAVGLTESLAALQRWMVSGPEMARLINDFEALIHHSVDTVDVHHHEQWPGVQKSFLQDVKALKSAFDEYWNPFLESSSSLLVLDTKDITSEAVVDTVNKIEEIGLKHTKILWMNALLTEQSHWIMFSRRMCCAFLACLQSDKRQKHRQSWPR